MTEQSGKDQEPTLSVELLYEDDERTVVRIALRGLNRRTINHQSTTIYEVIAGAGTIEVDGAIQVLRQGIAVTIPVGTPYRDEGTVDMVAMSIPPFDIDAIEYLD